MVEEILGYKFMRGQKYGGLLKIPPYLDPPKNDQHKIMAGLTFVASNTTYKFAKILNIKLKTKVNHLHPRSNHRSVLLQ